MFKARSLAAAMALGAVLLPALATKVHAIPVSVQGLSLITSAGSLTLDSSSLNVSLVTGLPLTVPSPIFEWTMISNNPGPSGGPSGVVSVDRQITIDGVNATIDQDFMGSFSAFVTAAGPNPADGFFHNFSISGGLEDSALLSVQINPTEVVDVIVRGLSVNVVFPQFVPGPCCDSATVMFGGPLTTEFLLRRLVQVPEPGTLALFGFGLAGLGFIRRRKSI